MRHSALRSATGIDQGAGFDKGAASGLGTKPVTSETCQAATRIDRINTAYKDVKSGDRYYLTYLPGRGAGE